MRTRGISRTLLGLFAAVCCLAWGEPLRVVATTSHLAALVRAIGGTDVSVTTIIPAGMCPGHFDMRPADRYSVEKGSLILAHGWETVLPGIESSTRQGAVRRVSVEGNWLVPSVQKEAGRSVAFLLSEALPRRASFFSANLQRHLAEMDRLEKDALTRIETAGLKGVPVICQDMVAPFLSFLGMKVVATYGREEELAPSALAALVKTGRQANVRLIVDNLQAGPKAGVSLARELGIPRATVSNFPGGMPRTDSVAACVHDNISRLISAYASRH